MQPNQILDFLPYPTIQALKTRKDQTNNCYPSTVLFFDVAELHGTDAYLVSPPLSDAGPLTV